MKTLLFATLALTAACLYSTGCAVAPKSANQRLVTDASGNPIACTVNADCPTGSECESEAEHGQKTTFCQLHDESENEVENESEVENEVEGADDKSTGVDGGGSSADDNSAAGADDNSAAGADDNSAAGADDNSAAGADDNSAAGADDNVGAGTGAGAAGAACATSADCGAGLECDTENEHGVTTATCQPHKGGKV